MASQKKWVLGIDPGFGNTGAVLRLSDEAEVKCAACWRNEATHDWPVLRAMSICIPMMEAAMAWSQEHDIQCLEVCLESPIYARNPGTLMVQMALFTLVQAYVYDYLVPIIPKVYLTIVNNKTSKAKMAHDGGADKHAMIKASPWYNYKDTNVTYNQAHTLADSYAHSLSAHTEQYALHKLPQYMVESNYLEEN